MQKLINIEGKEINYTLKFHARTNGLRLSVTRDGSVRVVMRKVFFAERVAERFIREQGEWLLEQISKAGAAPRLKSAPGEFEKYKEIARAKLEKKVDEFNKFYGYKYGRVSIKRASTRWGSCSSKGNLNFNYKLIFMPEEMMNYVVVHELCHLRELNHSKNFWDLVSIACPKHLEIRKAFKTQRI